jgi:hypothetical protein
VTWIIHVYQCRWYHIPTVFTAVTTRGIYGWIFCFKAVSAKAQGEVRVTTTEVVTTATTTSTQRTLQIVDGAVQSVKVSESKATLLNTHKSVVASHPSRYAGK